jgi:DNA-binding Xre family transcriptional regulator
LQQFSTQNDYFVTSTQNEVVIMESFDNISIIMVDKNISQKQLADCLGVSEQRVHDWKVGRIKSWTKYIDKIATCLGVTIADCLGVVTEKPVTISDDGFFISQ